MLGSPPTFHTHSGRIRLFKLTGESNNNQEQWGTSAPPSPGMVPCLAASTGTLPQRPPLEQHPQLRAPGAAARVGRGLLPTRTMTTRAPAPQVSGPPRRGYLQLPQLPPLTPTFVCRRPHLSATSCVRCRQRAFWVSFGRLPAASTCRRRIRLPSR